MKVYLAAAFSRKDEIKQVAEELRERGITITSRWLDEPTYPAYDINHAEFLRQRAQIDLADINEADILIRFSDDLSFSLIPSHLATGSRMGEMMWALAHGKKVYVVGGHQCIFDWLPEITHLPRYPMKYTGMMLAAYLKEGII